jgi:hypothetical protein
VLSFLLKEVILLDSLGVQDVTNRITKKKISNLTSSNFKDFDLFFVKNGIIDLSEVQT